MKKYKLKNGILLIYEKKPSKSVAIEVMVKVGSNDEDKKMLGISHFIEHMLFEGTRKRKSSMEIANEIEKLGGEINAYTSNERTAFFVKLLGKHFEKALDVLSDIIQNPLFDEKMVEKERKVLLKEINMVTDEPRFHQWILFTKTLFKKHPAKHPTYGSIQTVNKISRNDLLDYYKKHYFSGNIIISIAGNVKNIKSKTEKYFSTIKNKKFLAKRAIKEPRQKKPTIKTEKKKILNSYIVLGYKTTSRLQKESYALDVIRAVLGRGQSGKLFDEIRNKRGLAYDVGVQHEPSTDYGFFAVYLGTDKKNISIAKKIILEEFSKLKNISEKDLKEAKDYLEGEFLMQNEDNFHMADKLAFWELIKDASLAKEYLKNVKNVKKEDIARVVNKYLNKNYTMAVIEQA